MNKNIKESNDSLSKLVQGINTIAKTLEQIKEQNDILIKNVFVTTDGGKLKSQVSFNNSVLWQWSLAENNQCSTLKPIVNQGYIPLSLIVGYDSQAKRLTTNIQHFANNKVANHALLWGSRGCGKSSLVMACIAEVIQNSKSNIKVIEINRDSIHNLSKLWSLLISEESKYKFIVLCDDLTFENSSSSYKSFKTLIDGSINSRTNKILLIATSNRRHLMPRDILDNESKLAIHGNEAIDEKVSLSDRFGLWLGFHAVNQELYLKIISNYMTWGKVKNSNWHKESLSWAMTRGSRSGRVAWQFFIDYCANNSIKIPALPTIT